MKTYKLRVIPKLGQNPIWVTIDAQSKTGAISLYYSTNPTHVVVWVKEVEK